MRFSLAREAGLTESVADRIDDRFATADLPDPWKVALRVADHLIVNPGPLPDDLQRELATHFDRGQQTELLMGIALFHGFSKMLIVLGLEPEHMDTTIVTTPSPVRRSDIGPDTEDTADAHVALLADRPDLARRWAHMVAQLSRLLADDAGVMELARRRVAQLLGAHWATEGLDEHGVDPAVEVDVVTLAELFVIDVRAVDTGLRGRLSDALGQDRLVQLVMALAVYDGIYRIAAARR